MAKSAAPPRLAVLGAGPVGLEAGLYAKALQLPFTIYERGRVGEHLRRWGHVKLFSPFGMNATPLGRRAVLDAKRGYEFPGDDALLTGREHVEKYLAPLAETLRENLRAEAQVIQVGRRGFLKGEAPGDAARARQPFLLLVREKTGERLEEADVVLDCTGTYGQHRWLGSGGIPAPGELAAQAQIAYDLPDVLGERQKDYANRSVLVVGGGFSAATTVCSLARLAEQHNATWITWLARSPHSQPLRRLANDPLRERDRLAMQANNLATRTDGNVEYHPGSVVEAVEKAGPDGGFRVTSRAGGQARTWDVDRIVANVGYTPDATLCRELQVHECYASLGPMKLAAALLGQKGLDCLKQTCPGPESLRNPEPNFYVLGAKSYGRGAQFLLRVGFEQVRDVFALIPGLAIKMHLPLIDPRAPLVPLTHLDALWFQAGGTLCNLECRHCFISCSPHNRSFGFLTLDEVRRALDESVALGVKEYYFTGGEPFLNRDMPAILELTLRYGPATVLTNGTVLRDDWLRRLRAAEDASAYSLEFRVSLDGYSAEENDPVRGEGTFERILKGVRLLLAHDFLPILTVTRTRDDQDDAELFHGFVRLLKDNGYARPRVKILPTLRIGAEACRQRGYAAEERVTPEMMAGYDAELLVCSHSRVVTDRGVYVCPILIEEPAARLGDTLAEALRPAALAHPACFTCYQYGALCANASAQQRDA